MRGDFYWLLVADGNFLTRCVAPAKAEHAFILLGLFRPCVGQLAVNSGLLPAQASVTASSAVDSTGYLVVCTAASTAIVFAIAVVSCIRTCGTTVHRHPCFLKRLQVATFLNGQNRVWIIQAQPF